ncbi:neutral zinc metallopeptidase [Nonomuraea soli]|uniref:Metalloprotease-like protein n=1 Tax=Nonomuraea soli TaxID=1032476 RepID=A0A7W0HR32_9ACTN|nr:neutral zinc metallopeptidase [Nonomuraea soli]MBA2892211.1 hypothetical protein [Nonomuraea soli]
MLPLLVAAFLITGCSLLPVPSASTPPAPTKQAARPKPTATAKPRSKPSATPAPRRVLSDPPVGDAARDRNPLNKLTKARPRACKTPAVPYNSWRGMRNYLAAFASCLDRHWKAEFTRAGLKFQVPRRSFLSKPAKKACGGWIKGATGLYCGDSRSKDYRRLWVLITKDDLYPEARIYMVDLIAHEYGHHVQEMSGFGDVTNRAYWRADGEGKKAEDAVTRRSELQAQCFSGIGLGVFYDALFPTPTTLDQYRESIVTWDQDNEWDRTHGLPRTQFTWFDRGFDQLRPAACDTWHARAARVK